MDCRIFFYSIPMPLYYGAGHLQPYLVMDPRLVYDVKPIDYLDYAYSTGQDCTNFLIGYTNYVPKKIDANQFNYPSITLA